MPATRSDLMQRLKALPRTIGSARLSFGRPDLLVATLCVTPGSVTAFALINDRECRVAVIVDATLSTFQSINCHPLENSATTSIARDDLLRFIRACGHEPQFLYQGAAGGGPQELAPYDASGRAAASDGMLTSPPPDAVGQ